MYQDNVDLRHVLWLSVTWSSFVFHILNKRLMLNQLEYTDTSYRNRCGKNSFITCHLNNKRCTAIKQCKKETWTEDKVKMQHSHDVFAEVCQHDLWYVTLLHPKLGVDCREPVHLCKSNTTESPRAKSMALWHDIGYKMVISISLSVAVSLELCNLVLCFSRVYVAINGFIFL